MKEEIQAIEKNQIWDLVILLKGKNAVGLKWVCKMKYNFDGSIQRYKECLVVKGYSQIHGIDFEKTFSPIARFETVQVFLALGAKLKWPIYQLDIKSAFLNGVLQEEVYVFQLEGFLIKDSEDKVYKL